MITGILKSQDNITDSITILEKKKGVKIRTLLLELNSKTIKNLGKNKYGIGIDLLPSQESQILLHPIIWSVKKTSLDACL